MKKILGITLVGFIIGSTSIIGCPAGESSGLFPTSGSGTINCPAGTKQCGNECSDLENPATGCGSQDCSPCNLPGAVAICAGGKCEVDHCVQGFKDCDSDHSNGCEVSLETDVDNCGECSHKCEAVANSGSICNLGECKLVCDSSYGDCNMNYNDGCEMNVAQGDQKNCGACGKECLNGSACKTNACACVSPFIYWPGTQSPLPGTPEFICNSCVEEHCCSEIVKCKTNDSGCTTAIINIDNCIKNGGTILTCQFGPPPSPSVNFFELESCIMKNNCKCN